jgi:hypothetical protein
MFNVGNVRATCLIAQHESFIPHWIGYVTEGLAIRRWIDAHPITHERTGCVPSFAQDDQFSGFS